MSPIRNLTYHDIFRHPEHCVNQIAQRTLKNGDVLAVFNEERFPFHHDSGQTLMTRSQDGGLTWSEPRIIVPWTATQGNWDCGICELGDGTLAYDPNNIIDYEEAGIVRLDNGCLASFMRTHLQPSQDTKCMIMVVSEDDGFTWSQPKWTRIWGYPPELIRLQDGRYLLVYGYRRPSYGVRGIISDSGIGWDVGNEFVISEGGIPATSHVAQPSSSRVVPAAGLYDEGAVNYFHPGLYQHIGYPTVAQAADGTVVCSYHEWSRDERPL